MKTFKNFSGFVENDKIGQKNFSAFKNSKTLSKILRKIVSCQG